VDRQRADTGGASLPEAAHRHQWSAIDFLVADDRPMMRQRCPCGAGHDIPAWDRLWQPPNEEPGPT
jgi:hypothetical protein